MKMLSGITAVGIYTAPLLQLERVFLHNQEWTHLKITIFMSSQTLHIFVASIIALFFLRPVLEYSKLHDVHYSLHIFTAYYLHYSLHTFIEPVTESSHLHNPNYSIQTFIASIAVFISSQPLPVFISSVSSDIFIAFITVFIFYGLHKSSYVYSFH